MKVEGKRPAPSSMPCCPSHLCCHLKCALHFRGPKSGVWSGPGVYSTWNGVLHHPCSPLEKAATPGGASLELGDKYCLAYFCQDSKIAYVERTKTFMRSCLLLSLYLSVKGGVIQDGESQFFVKMVHADNSRRKSSLIRLTMI